MSAVAGRHLRQLGQPRTGSSRGRKEGEIPFHGVIGKTNTGVGGSGLHGGVGDLDTLLVHAPLLIDRAGCRIGGGTGLVLVVVLIDNHAGRFADRISRVVLVNNES